MIVCNPVNRNMYKSTGYRVHVGCVMTNNNVSGDILKLITQKKTRF